MNGWMDYSRQIVRSIWAAYSVKKPRMLTGRNVRLSDLLISSCYVCGHGGSRWFIWRCLRRRSATSRTRSQTDCGWWKRRASSPSARNRWRTTTDDVTRKAPSRSRCRCAARTAPSDDRAAFFCAFPLTLYQNIGLFFPSVYLRISIVHHSEREAIIVQRRQLYCHVE